jgi:Sulfotransferase family
VAVPDRVAVHIGYHKTATTWFQQIPFRNHPRIAPLLGGSEFGVVASDDFLRQIIFQRDSDFNAANARALLGERADSLVTDSRDTLVISAERLSGHAASGGYDAVRIADRLHATVPGARIFWVLRHQVEAIRSEYKQIVLAGWPGSLRDTLAPAPKMKTVGVDLAYWEYERLLSAYVDRFGRERVMVIDFGQFTRDRGHVLNDLARFLDIDPWSLSGDQLTTRMNEGESDRHTRLRQLFNHFTATELNPFPPIDIPDRVSAMAVRILGPLQRRRAVFGPSFEEWVEERYAASNKRLAEQWGVVLTRSTKAE